MRLLWIGLACLPLLAADSVGDFRVVDGRLYNIQKSVLWLRVSGSPLYATNGAMLFAPLRKPPPGPAIPPEYVTTRYGGGHMGYYYETTLKTPDLVINDMMTSGKSHAIRQGHINSWALPDNILIRGLSNKLPSVVAMRVGETNGLQLWDVGTMPATTNRTERPRSPIPPNHTEPSP